VFNLLFEHFATLVLLQLVLAGIIIMGGVALLKNRRWGGFVVGGAAFLGLAYVMGFSVVFLHEVGGIRALPAQADAGRVGMMTFLAIAVAGSAVFWGTPLVLTLYVLRRPRVRQALQ
jgi:hypothetical protein